MVSRGSVRPSFIISLLRTCPATTQGGLTSANEPAAGWFLGTFDTSEHLDDYFPGLVFPILPNSGYCHSLRRAHCADPSLQCFAFLRASNVRLGLWRLFSPKFSPPTSACGSNVLGRCASRATSRAHVSGEWCPAWIQAQVRIL
ncbi:hypothetical protein ACLKA7_001441 [Drosophila subpalustris]